MAKCKKTILATIEKDFARAKGPGDLKKIIERMAAELRDNHRTIRDDVVKAENGGVSGTYPVYNDGTSGNVTEFTTVDGIITSVTTAP